MEILDKRLNDKGKNWRHVFKVRVPFPVPLRSIANVQSLLQSLTLLDYCLHAGSENVVIYFRDNIYVIKTLKEFQYVDEYGKDQGANVRQKAKDITNLLSDDTRLREERRARAHMRDRMTSRSPVDETDLGDENERRRSRSRQNARGDGTDDDLRKAIEESKKTAAAETGHLTAEDRDLQEALRLSREEEDKRKKAAQDSTESALFDDNNQLCVSKASPCFGLLTWGLGQAGSRQRLPID